MREIKIYSHPDILLRDHLVDVTQNILEIFESKDIKFYEFSSFKINYEMMRVVLIVTGLFHDFGKHTSFFQNKLLHNISSLESHHSCISAFIGNEFFKHFVNKFQLQINDKEINFYRVLIFICIRRHHSDLVSLEDEFNKNITAHLTEWRLIHDQLNNIISDDLRFNQLIENYYYLMNEFGFNISRSDLESFFKRSYSIFSSLDKIVSYVDSNLKSFILLNFSLENKNFEYYLILVLSYSILLDSDKKISSKTESLSEKVIESKIFINHVNFLNINSKSEISLNNLRKSFFNEINFTTENFNIDKKEQVMTITAPTGIGKTLTTFTYALKFREVMKDKFQLKSNPKIIYCLPFTSIVDQNFDVIENILLKSIPDYFNNKLNYLIKHHHLSNFENYSTEDTELSLNQKYLLAESWNSEIIITTFYQVFYTLFLYKNSNALRFHNLVNSIVILDEIQSFPLKYWNILRLVSLNFTNLINCRFLLITATQPNIYRPNEVNHLIKTSETYFKHKNLNRINLTLKKNHIIVSEFIKIYKDLILKYSSSIIVLNTKDQSKIIYWQIKSSIDDIISISELLDENDETNKKNIDFENLKNKIVLLYLSTYLPPIIRKTRIRMINYLKEKNIKFIVITTQLIEAGVDIDAELVIRDFGPLDSIIQVSGRCNRNNKSKNKGLIVIQPMKNEMFKEYAKWIYDPEIIEITWETFTLFDKKIYSEHDFYNLSQIYFNLLAKKLEKIQDLSPLLSKLNFRNLIKNKDNKINSIKDMKLIERDYEEYNLILELTDHTSNIIKNILELKNKISKRKEFELSTVLSLRYQIRSLKMSLLEYSINISKKDYDKLMKLSLIRPILNLLIIEEKNLNKVFTKEIGYNLDIE